MKNSVWDWLDGHEECFTERVCDGNTSLSAATELTRAGAEGSAAKRLPSRYDVISSFPNFTVAGSTSEGNVCQWHPVFPDFSLESLTDRCLERLETREDGA